ncbi:MAG TPA: 16S rRNA (cytosine(1402)-N(4))-methyltransferase RsmH [bacterium]|nr:16S rRNA (cytosine(1402)-N(4))-methyltransferase RsmH [bacterium]
MPLHQAVLPKEALEYLAVKANGNYIDATFGQGGHSRLILEASAPKGTVLGIDWNAEAFAGAGSLKSLYEKRLTMKYGNFADLDLLMKSEKRKYYDGILADLGWSMDEIKSSGLGLSFQIEEPLNMVYGNAQGDNAWDLVNKASFEKLLMIFRDYGEERWAHRIATRIVENRKLAPIDTSTQLADLIANSIPKRFHSHHIHPATRVFQALRIAVNHELENLEKFLVQAKKYLKPGGRLVVISFHSLEDRIVKQAFRQWMKDGEGKVITKKPVIAGAEELEKNRASRSAKLRAWERG